MDFLGHWKMKEMLSADENGVKMLNREEIAALAQEDDDLRKLLEADFILGEESLDMYYQPTEEELPLAVEEGWEITERGVLIESYPTRIEDGVLLMDYEKEGAEYFPVKVDENGCLIISDNMMKLEKV